MRRCPHCSSPNQDLLKVCQACGRTLAPLRAQPWLTWSEVLDPMAVKAALIFLPAVLLYRRLWGSLLMRGMDPREWRPALFHLGLGLLLGAFASRKRSPWYLLAGVLGGLLAAALEASYMGGHVVSTAVFKILFYLGVFPEPDFTYKTLLALRYSGLVLPLWLLAVAQEKRPWKSLLDLVLLGFGLLLACQVKGAAMLVFSLAGFKDWGLWALALALVLYTFFPRGLTPAHAKP